MSGLAREAVFRTTRGRKHGKKGHRRYKRQVEPGFNPRHLQGPRGLSG